MGTIKQGVFGELSGKVGNVVGYKRKGVNRLRIQAASISNPKTPKQQMQRGKISIAVNFLKTINPYIRIGYKNYAKGNMTYNAAMSYIMRRAIIEEGGTNVLDFKRIMVSIGFLTTVPDATATMEDDVIIFRWADNSGMGNAESTDIAMLLVYNKERELAIYDTDAATRTDTYAQISLPKEWSSDTMISYLSFRSINGEEVSNSIRL